MSAVCAISFDVGRILTFKEIHNGQSIQLEGQGFSVAAEVELKFWKYAVFGIKNGEMLLALRRDKAGEFSDYMGQTIIVREVELTTTRASIALHGVCLESRNSLPKSYLLENREWKLQRWDANELAMVIFSAMLVLIFLVMAALDYFHSV